jgi:hypothetical protein
MENRNGLLVDLRIDEANGTAEVSNAAMLADNVKVERATVAGDKLFDTQEFVAATRYMNLTPHVAQNNSRRRSAIDDRTTRHAGYTISQRLRKRVEEIFGWTKSVANFRRTRYKGRSRTQMASYFVGAAQPPPHLPLEGSAQRGTSRGASSVSAHRRHDGAAGEQSTRRGAVGRHWRAPTNFSAPC